MCGACQSIRKMLEELTDPKGGDIMTKDGAGNSHMGMLKVFFNS